MVQVVRVFFFVKLMYFGAAYRGAFVREGFGEIYEVVIPLDFFLHPGNLLQDGPP